MAWQPKDLMDIRQEFVTLALQEGADRRERCAMPRPGRQRRRRAVSAFGRTASGVHGPTVASLENRQPTAGPFSPLAL